jgi:hypothetical protein
MSFEQVNKDVFAGLAPIRTTDNVHQLPIMWANQLNLS